MLSSNHVIVVLIFYKSDMNNNIDGNTKINAYHKIDLKMNALYTFYSISRSP